MKRIAKLLEEKLMNFLKYIDRLFERLCYNNLYDFREDMILYRDKNVTGGYRYTCKTCRLRIVIKKHMIVDLSKIKVSRLIDCTYLNFVIGK